MRRLLPLLFLTASLSSFAQTQTGPTPAQTLRLARATYEQGRLHEIPSYLNDKVIADMNEQEKVEAYKILCLSYIYLEEPEKADEAMLNILQTDPYFEINPAVDPAEFVALYKTFRTKPIYRIGAILGGNFTEPNVSEIINTTSGTADFKYKFGLQFGVSADLPLRIFKQRFTLHGDLLYQQKKFEMQSENNQGDGDLNKTLATETQTWLALPLSLQYYLLNQDLIKERKYNPYVSLGVSTDLRLNASLNAERTREGETSVEPKNFDLKSEREAINISATVAAGLKTRFAGGLIVLEFKYLYGLTKINHRETSYSNQDLYLVYGMPNTIFKLNSVSFTASYVQNIFKPKKLTVRK